LFITSPFKNLCSTILRALNGLHDDGEIGGTGDSWKQYAKSGDIILDLAGGLGGGVGAGLSGVGETFAPPFLGSAVSFL
jgi:hypothetical protein